MDPITRADLLRLAFEGRRRGENYSRELALLVLAGSHERAPLLALQAQGRAVSASRREDGAGGGWRRTVNVPILPPNLPPEVTRDLALAVLAEESSNRHQAVLEVVRRHAESICRAWAEEIRRQDRKQQGQP